MENLEAGEMAFDDLNGEPPHWGERGVSPIVMPDWGHRINPLDWLSAALHAMSGRDGAGRR